MSNLTDLETVVGFAVQFEDLDRSERKALINVAHRVDRDLNKQTTGNPEADRTYENPSRLALAAGCAKANCRVCTKVPDRSTGPVRRKS